MLRAVLSLRESESVLRRHTITYLGEQFPNMESTSDSESDFAVLRFSTEETSATRLPGFYRLESDLASVNELLRDLSR